MTDLRGLHRGRLPGILGSVASVLAIGAFCYAFASALSARGAAELLYAHWDDLVAGLVVYGLAFVPMVVAWCMFARTCGATLPSTHLAGIFLTSQIGKYLPGNVGQFLGRAYLANRAAVPLKTSAVAMALEVAGVLTAGSILAAVSSAFGLAGAGRDWVYFLAVVAAGGSLAASLVMVRLKIGPIRPFLKPLTLALICYLSVFGLLAAINIWLVALLSGDHSWAMVWSVSAAVVISWLVGFVTPGAPAGLGLREVTFSALLIGVYGAEVVLLSALGFRLITMSGDLLALLVGLVVRSDKERRLRPA